MTKAIRVHRYGGPEVLSWEEVSVGRPGPGEALIRHTAVGINFIELQHRAGHFSTPLPSGLGTEAAGVVEEIGPGVIDLSPGDRVVSCEGPLGAYSEARIVPAHRLLRLPDGVSDVQAAAATLKGITAQYLLRRTYPVGPGDTILFHAAAGGVGSIACQWAKHLGATVIGTAGGPSKVAFAKANGCDHVIDYTREDFVGRVLEITKGKKVPVVYDSVGKDTFSKSLECLAPLGMMVSFGNASGPIDPIDLGALAQRGSLFVTRASLSVYGAKRADLLAMAKELFELLASSTLRVEINRTYPLSEAAQAHRDLADRKTAGAIVLTV
jgi:NADPH2:quinone reductase